MRLPVSEATILREVESAQQILTEIRDRLDSIPGVTMPGSEQQLSEFLRELCGDLFVASNKCNGLAQVLSELGTA